MAKKILEQTNKQLKDKTNNKQWKNADEVKKWFQNLQQKHTLHFIEYDVKDFYPSISEDLLDRAMEWADRMVGLSENDKEIIRQTKKSLLYSSKEPWTKKGDSNFDVAMGSFDGAEVCEMIGLFMLEQVKPVGIDGGLYRDDGLGASRLGRRTLQKKAEEMRRIFLENGLEIIICANKKVVHFLEIEFDLEMGTFRPKGKAEASTEYVHTQSNHPPSILKNIPIAVNKRLSELSSNKDIFDEAAPRYQDALKRAGYDHKLEHIEEADQEGSKKKRKRKVVWFNPPYSMNCKTKIGKKFIELVKKCFPKDGPLGKVFNTNNLKMSYRTLPNMKQTISAHNKKIISDDDKQTQQDKDKQDGKKKAKKRTCSCPENSPDPCPLDGHCLATNIIYHAEVTETDTENKQTIRKYVGLTEGDFKSRLGNHKKSFKHRHYGKETKLSTHIWEVKDRGSEWSIKWRILDRGNTYNPATKVCNLCLKEKYWIIYHSELACLNSRNEINTKCMHKRTKMIGK